MNCGLHPETAHNKTNNHNLIAFFIYILSLVTNAILQLDSYRRGPIPVKSTCETHGHQLSRHIGLCSRTHFALFSFETVESRRMTRLALLVVLASSPAHAEDTAHVAALRAQLHTYYSGEALAGVPFTGAGIASGLTGAGLLATGDSTARGAAWPMFGFAALEAAFGLYLALRNPSRLAEFDARLTANPQAFVTDERARLKSIVHTYQPILLTAWAVVAAGGGGLATAGHFSRDTSMVGVGLGLAVQGLVMFLLDWTVLDRARAWEAALAHFPL